MAKAVPVSLPHAALNFHSLLRQDRMNMQEEEGYTARQLRELEYHREHAKKFRYLADQPTGYEVALSDARRWWNP